VSRARKPDQGDRIGQAKKTLRTEAGMQENPTGCLSTEAMEWLGKTSVRLPETEPYCRHLEGCPSCWERYLARVSPLTTVQVHGFLILEEIGRGASSAVYAAWRCSGPVKLTALKVLWQTDEEQRVRFEREAAIHRRLDSPGIVKGFGLGRQGRFVYYDMELIRGEPLDVYLAQHAQTLSYKLRVFERVCRALAAAHEHGVAHRDIKPGNILVDAHGQPHLLDFGLGAVQSEDLGVRMRLMQTKLGRTFGRWASSSVRSRPMAAILTRSVRRPIVPPRRPFCIASERNCPSSPLSRTRSAVRA
jgi:serine/threonine protein kinase